MNAPVTLAISEAQDIERALDVLLSSITAHDHQPRATTATFEVRSIADLTRATLARLDRTPAGRFADDLAKDPVRGALVYAVRQLGKRLHEIGGLEAMQQACDRVANMDPPNWGRRTCVMDARWDGIGRTDKSAGWCS